MHSCFSSTQQVEESALELNLLLRAFPGETRRRWLAQLEWVDLRHGQVLHDPNRKITHVYFPTTAIIGLLHVLEDGATSEVAAVGHMGLVGVVGFMGGGLRFNQAVVQMPGRALRLPVHALRAELEGGGAAFHLVLRYTAALFAQASQISVCHRHHSLDQRLSGWLLLRRAWLQSDHIPTTHEQIANFLGVRRAGVSERVSDMRRQGVVQTARGCVTLLDIDALARCACGCHLLVRSAYQRLLSRAYERDVPQPVHRDLAPASITWPSGVAPAGDSEASTSTWIANSS